ncbi:unnamed protein product, partial [Phytomonas sp. EM1]
MPMNGSEGSAMGSWKASKARRSGKNTRPNDSITQKSSSNDKKPTLDRRNLRPFALDKRTSSSKSVSGRPTRGGSALPELQRASGAPVLARAAIAALPGVLASRATGSCTPSSTSYQRKGKNPPPKGSKGAGVPKRPKASDRGSVGSTSRKWRAAKSVSTRSAGSIRSRKLPSSTMSKTQVSKRKSSSKGLKTLPGTKPTRGGRGVAKSMGKRSSQRYPSSSTGRGSKAASLHSSVRQYWTAQFEILEEDQSSQRQAILVEEELEREGYTPVYNVLVMNMVRVCIEQINRQQKLLRDTFDKLQSDGLSIGSDDSMDAVLEKLRSRMSSDGVAELHRLRAEKASLREQLDAKTLELELRTSDLEVLRQNAICTVAQKVARVDVDTENLKAKAERVLLEATLDVEGMKKELLKRIDIASAHLRTPQYGTALRSIRVLAEQTQKEVQRHHDSLTELILSIEAKSNLAKFVSATMHSGIPPEYRKKLRQMSNDKLLNILDVLSFQEGVVDCIGKVLYALEESEHKTAVI